MLAAAAERMVEFLTSLAASASSASRSDGFAPGPMKPIPPASDTARARAGPPMTRIGAPTMIGVLSHGRAVFRYFIAWRGAAVAAPAVAAATALIVGDGVCRLGGLVNGSYIPLVYGYSSPRRCHQLGVVI